MTLKPTWRDAVLHIRLSRKSKRVIERLARARGLNVSEYARNVLLRPHKGVER